MRHKALRVWAVVATCVAAGAQTAEFRAGVSLVHVDAGVYGRDGKVVDGLSKADFRIFDGEEEREIVAFSRSEVPLDLVLLFDASGSMRVQVEKVSQAVARAFEEIREGDRVSVMAFNTEVFMATPFTADRSAIEQDVRELLARRFGGGTRIRKAVDEAAVRLGGEPKNGRRRAVLVITDDIGDPFPREQRVTEDLWEADTVLFGLMVKPAHTARRWLHLGGIAGIAEKSGGEAIVTKSARADLPLLVKRLRNRYDLYYRMPEAAPGTWRDVRVALSDEVQGRLKGARVYARKGYRVSE